MAKHEVIQARQAFNSPAPDLLPWAIVDVKRGQEVAWTMSKEGADEIVAPINDIRGREDNLKRLYRALKRERPTQPLPVPFDRFTASRANEYHAILHEDGKPFAVVQGEDLGQVLAESLNEQEARAQEVLQLLREFQDSRDRN